MNARIEKRDNSLLVPENPVIPFIEGDGIGKEITPAVREIIDAAVRKAYEGRRAIEWREVLAGEKAWRETGSWLPDETMTLLRENLVAIKGPLTTPVGEGIRSLNVTLRQTLDLYACQRPVRWFRGVPSPVLHPERVNMCIFRENTEDIYAGIEWMSGSDEAKKFYRFLSEEMGVSKVRFPDTSAFGVKPVSVEGTERIVRAAISYALDMGMPSVTIVHKGNIMKYTEGGFKKWGYALAEREFGDKVFTFSRYESLRKEHGEQVAAGALSEARSAGKLIIKDIITDAFLQNSLLKPEDYSVIVTLNLNGDYISDQLAAMVGGIGISPGANINYVTGHAIFEATHGTAPDMAGKGIANPCSLLLSAVMMLEYLGWTKPATMITESLEMVFTQGYATPDLANMVTGGKALTTNEFAQRLITML